MSGFFFIFVVYVFGLKRICGKVFFFNVVFCSGQKYLFWVLSVMGDEDNSIGVGVLNSFDLLNELSIFFCS